MNLGELFFGVTKPNSTLEDLLHRCEHGVFGRVIAIRNVGPFWRSDYRLYVGRRDKTSLAENLGWQVEAVRTALTAAGVDPLPPITPVLCFIDGEWPIFRAPDEFQGVRLEGPGSIKRLVTASIVLDAAAIDRFARILAAALPAK